MSDHTEVDREFDEKFIDPDLQMEKEGQVIRANKNLVLLFDIKDFLHSKIEEARLEERRRTIHNIYRVMKKVFWHWCGESNFVTGAWSTGEEVEREKQGEYWDFIRKNAWEQFASRLDEKLAGKDISSLTGEKERV